MSRTLFHIGITACILAALLGITAVARFAIDGAAVPVAGPAAAPTLLVLIGATFGVAALLLRVASMMAARNLFAALLAGSAIASASLLAVVAAVLRYPVRVTRVIADEAVAGDAAAVLSEAAAFGSAFFVAVTLLALRPYFRLHAQFLAPLLPLPALLLVTGVAAHAFGSTFRLLPVGSLASAAFVTAVAAFLLSFAIHCTSHRRLFTEVTNLRSMLEPRFDPAGRRLRPRMPLDGIAYDS
jgi:hypothetical protein